MKQTATHKLSQWEKNDRILMEDFNADNAKLEAALNAQSASLQSLQSSTDASVKTLQTSIQSAQTTLQNSINSLQSSTQTSLTNLTGSVNKRGNCQISLVTYTGENNGVSGRPKVLNLPYRPMAVWISSSAKHYTWAVRGMVHAIFTGDPTNILVFSWGERSVSWYASTSASGMDSSLYSYNVVVLQEIP